MIDLEELEELKKLSLQEDLEKMSIEDIMEILKITREYVLQVAQENNL